MLLKNEGFLSLLDYWLTIYMCDLITALYVRVAKVSFRFTVENNVNSKSATQPSGQKKMAMVYTNTYMENDVFLGETGYFKI